MEQHAGIKTRAACVAGDSDTAPHTHTHTHVRQGIKVGQTAVSQQNFIVTVNHKHAPEFFQI